MREFVSEGSWLREAHASHERAASWNPYFYAFFGSEHNELRSAVRPLSGDESCVLFSQVIDASGDQHPRPKTLKRSLLRMWSSGYRPSTIDNESRFKELASYAVARKLKPDEAFRALVEDSDQPSQPTGAESAQFRGAAMQPPPVPKSPPTVVTFDGRAWSVKKELLVRSSIDGVAPLLNPINWQLLAPFFKQTQRIDTLQKAKDPTAPWSGILHEKVVFNWNMFTLQCFDAILNVDYTVASDVVRADYSLRYEKQNQLIIDEGYVEAHRESAEVTHYTVLKRLRFASSILNLLAPALLALLLEQDEGGFRDILEREADAVTPLVRAIRAPSR